MLQEALSQEDLTQSEFSAVLDSLQNVTRDTNVKVVRCISKLRYVAVVCILLFGVIIVLAVQLALLLSSCRIYGTSH